MFAMRGAFDEMLRGRVRSTLRVEEVFTFLVRKTFDEFHAGIFYEQQSSHCANVCMEQR